MQLDQLRHAHQARPFKPFDLCLVDGRRLRVPHPEFLFAPPGHIRTIVVYGQDENVYKVIDLLHISSIDFGNGKARQPRRRKAS